jgi:hypothetical protein
VILIRLDNAGSTLLSTSYWATAHAQRGLLYLSINAGALRLLVPAAIRSDLEAGCPPVGTPCEVSQGRDRIEIAWLDDPARPWAIEIDARQCDRRLPDADSGRVLPLLWYVPLLWYAPGIGGESAVEIRREAATLRRIR